MIMGEKLLNLQGGASRKLDVCPDPRSQIPDPRPQTPLMSG